MLTCQLLDLELIPLSNAGVVVPRLQKCRHPHLSGIFSCQILDRAPPCSELSKLGRSRFAALLRAFAVLSMVGAFNSIATDSLILLGSAFPTLLQNLQQEGYRHGSGIEHCGYLDPDFFLRRKLTTASDMDYACCR